MIFYTIYNTSTGAINSIGGSDFALNNVHLESGESIIEGNYSPDLYKIVSGLAVELDTSGVIQATIRAERDLLLKECDWTQTIDSPLTDSKKAEWQTYRQVLRDLPANYQDSDSIDEITFPNLPQ
jgi:hypothetical protein